MLPTSGTFSICKKQLGRHHVDCAPSAIAFRFRLPKGDIAIATQLYANYDPQRKLASVLEYTAPSDGVARIRCVYSLRTSGTMEKRDGFFEDINETIEGLIPGAGLPEDDLFKDSEGDVVSYAEIFCYVNGALMPDKPGDKKRHSGFANTFLDWSHEQPLKKNEKLKVIVVRANVRADPQPHEGYNVDEHGFLLTGTFS